MLHTSKGQCSTSGFRKKAIMTAYRNSLSPYSMVPSLLPMAYHLLIIVYNDPLRSFKVDDFHLVWKDLCDFLLIICSNLGHISHRFWDRTNFWLKNARFFRPFLLNPKFAKKCPANSKGNVQQKCMFESPVKQN